LLVCFLIIIALLVTFIWFSVVYFRGNIKDEIIKYNTLNLRNTTESYEKQFELIRNGLYTFALNDKLKQLAADNFDYYLAYTLMEDIQQFVNNSALYLDNLIIVFKDSSFALEKSRGSDARTMFSRYFLSDDYSFEYWMDEFNRSEHMRIGASSVFAEVGWDKKKINPKTLIPIIVKNKQNPNFYMIALADARRMHADFHRSFNESFYVIDKAGRPYFASSPAESPDFPVFRDDHGFVKVGSTYYFYKKGKSGLTYVNLVPDRHIHSQMKWNLSFVLMLAFSVVLSVIASFLFSYLLNEPVKKFIDDIQKLNLRFPRSSRIKEFNIIQERLSQIVKANRDIHQDLMQKKSLLRYYAYMNKLKNIRFHLSDLNDLIVSDKPFTLILFRLTYKPQLMDSLGVEEDRATSFIREYVDLAVSMHHQESLTFQMENDQILSIVFPQQGDSEDMSESLAAIKQTLDLEKDYCFLTIAVCSRSKHFNEAYRRALGILNSRVFNDETQILYEPKRKDHFVVLTPMQEDEFDVNLINGNVDAAMQIVKRALAQLHKKEAGADQVMKFAEQIAQRIRNALLRHQPEADSAHDADVRLSDCFTYEQLEQRLFERIREAGQRIRDKKEKRDPIVDFVQEYLQTHYTQDITLDLLADKLNISRSYLSTYFKEKTGIYFIDYVNSFRIQKAKQLLAKSDIKIHEAAAQVGYQNINSFNRMFKKFTGVTPSEYRRSELVSD
jgi:YesN/AraC family two-component response regulator